MDITRGRNHGRNLNAQLAMLSVVLLSILFGALILTVWRSRNDAELYEAEGGAVPGPDLDGDGRPNDIAWRRTGLAVVISSGIDKKYLFLVASVVRELQDLLPGVISDVRKSDARLNPGARDTIFIDDDKGFSPKRGTTSVYREPDGSIVSADIILPLSALERGLGRNITRHELLHALGLGHSLNRDSVMYPEVWSDRQSIMSEDIRLLRRIFKGEPK